jgi:hypothetical protein
MARKPKHPFPLEGEPWGRTDRPWGQQASDLSNRTEVPFNLARDYVILTYLLTAGDTRPLIDLLQTGDAPGPQVLKYVAAMIGLPHENKLNMSLPYKLVVKGQDGRKAKDGELLWRDELLSSKMEAKMAEGERYKNVPDDIANELDGLIGRETIRKAYDGRHKKPKGN